MSLNKVMLIGNVGRDPEVRYLDGNGAGSAGTKVATFTLATSERYRDRSGELRENTEWHNIVAWRQSADVAEKFVRKGTQLYIEGRLRTRSYTGQDGVKKYTTEITVDNLQLLGKRDGAPEEGGDGVEVDVAAESTGGGIHVDAHVDHGGTRLNHVGRDETGLADGGNEDIRLGGNLRKILCMRMTHGNGGAGVQQQFCHRKTHDIAAAKHDGVLAVRVDACLGKKTQASCRSAGDGKSWSG